MVARLRWFRAPLAFFLTASLAMLSASRAVAQSVVITPDAVPIQAPANFSGDSVVFTVRNVSAAPNIYLYCPPNGKVTSCSAPVSVYVPVGSQVPVTVRFNTGAPGTGTVTLEGPGSDWGSYNVTVVPQVFTVAVRPDNQAQTVTGTIARSDTFTVENTGNMPDTYTFACSTTGSETCGAAVPPSQTLNPWGQVAVVVNFTPGAVGTSGTLILTATSSHTSDNGSFVVTNGPPPMVLSLAPYHDGFRPAGGFDVTGIVGTPAYVSMGERHAVTLTYSSAAVRPTPVIIVDVMSDGPPGPTKRSIQVRLAPSGPALTLLNGSTIAYYSAVGYGPPTRLAAAIDAKANGLATGFYPVNVTVTSYYSWGPNATTVSTRLFVQDLSASAFGAGWTVAGLQRILFQTGSNSVLVDNGDGALSYFDSSTPGSFTAPVGDPSSLAWNANGSVYARAYPDGDTVYFRADGRMSKVVDVKQITRLTLTWTDTLLTAIQDAAGKTLTLGYVAGKLQTVTDPSGRVTTFSIDGSQRLYRVTLPNGDTTKFAYDAQLKLQTVTDAAGGAWDYTYDGLNRIASSLAPTIQDYTGASVRPTTTYIAAERVVWQPGVPGTDSTVPKAYIWPDTVLASVTDPVGSSARGAYDRFGGATKVVDPFGQVTTIQRDTLGQPVQVTEPNGHRTISFYSGYHLTRVDDGTTARTVRYTWSTCSSGPQRVLTISGDVARQDFYYGLVGSSCPGGWLDSVYVGNTGTWAAPGGGTTTEKHYRNAWGQDTMVVDGVGHATHVAYKPPDQFGNTFQVTDPIGRVVAKYHYDNAGRVDTSWVLSNGAYGPTIATYDSLNRMRSVKNALGYVTQYQYGPLGLTRVIDAKGQVYKSDLNALGTVSVQHDLGDTTKADTLKYDIGGRLRVLKTRRGDQLAVTYDTVGQVLTRSGPDFPVDSFRYDPLGRWVVATNAYAYDSVAVDLRGRLTYSLERLTGGATYAMSYQYDVQDRLTLRSAPTANGTALGRPVRLTYDPTKGVVTKFCAAAGCDSLQNFDADQIPHTVAYTDTLSHPAWSRSDTTNQDHLETSDGFFTNTGTPIDLSAFQKTWTYDSLGRAGFEQANGAGPRYWYDANGQVMGACFWTNSPAPYTNVCYDEYGVDRRAFPPTGKTYSYDPAGNRVDSLAGAVVSAGNRTTSFKGYNVTYDPNGNVLTKYGTNSQWGTDSSTYTWDALSRLTSVTTWPAGGAHTTVSFTYDALGRRVSKTVNGVTQWYAHDGDQVAMILDSLGQRLKLELGWAPGTDNLAFVRAPAWTGVAITNPQIGTLLGLASPTPGAPLRKQYSWSPSAAWGETTGDTGTVVPFRMAGAGYDQETKLYYMRARYYDPQIGRFLSEDPAGIAGGLNLYVYAGNDPVNVSDPSGLDTECHTYGRWDDESTWVTVCRLDPAEVDAMEGPLSTWLDTPIIQPQMGPLFSPASVGEWLRSAVTDAVTSWAPVAGLARDDPGKQAYRQCSKASFFFGTSAALDATGVGELYRLGAGALRLGVTSLADALAVGGEVVQRYLYRTVVQHPEAVEAGLIVGYAQSKSTGKPVPGWEAVVPVYGTVKAGLEVGATC